MGEHVCNWSSAWPTGHPLPPEDPTKLRGPEVGARVIYQPKRESHRSGVEMVVLERSYVWSPGECRSRGGYRHYDWTVVGWTENGHAKRMVVNDDDLMATTALEAGL